MSEQIRERGYYAAFQDGYLVGCLFEDGTETAVEIAIDWLKHGHTIHRVTADWIKEHAKNRQHCEPECHAG